MKRLAIMLCVAASVVCANAKILRVCNISGSSAPYSTIKEAHDAASEGDTIMVDGSSDSYGDCKISKTLVLLGTGYWLLENNIVNVSVPTAKIVKCEITKEAPNTVVKGFEFPNGFKTSGIGTIVSRCLFKADLTLAAKKCIVHQNYFKGCCVRTGQFYIGDYYMQITNNIIYNGSIENIGGSRIAYNTIIRDNQNIRSFSDVITSTIEHNIINSEGILTNGWNDINSNVFKDNLIHVFSDVKNLVYDADVKTAESAVSEGIYGAFAGEDPYVISGIASGPYIEDIYVPVSVEQGDDMKVTLKIGTSR
ncbi:MAG: hypothetical protein Q4F85_14755 [Prevotella sp.]|nr:hypothetical protein [Prevotella sp.]